MEKIKLMKNILAKYYRLKLCRLFIVFIQLTFSSTSFCQPISTVSEIYNYSINDIFHVHEFGSSPGNGFSKYYNIKITNKYFSADNDTLFYARYINTAESTSDNPPWVYDNYTDIIYCTDLDSLINDGAIDSVYYDTLYNGRKINYTVYVPGYLSNDNKFIDGCGGPYFYYYNADPYVIHYLELLYFLKGTEEWGEPYYVSIDENFSTSQNIFIYPNPTQDKINVDFCNNNLKSKTIKGLISSIDGRIVKYLSFTTDKCNTIDLSNINRGTYFIRLISDKQVYNYKFIKD